MAGLRVLLIDANAAFSRAAKAFIGAMEDVTEVRTARTLETVLEGPPLEGTHLVIADCAALGWDAADAIARLRAAGMGPLLLLSLEDSQEARAAGMRAGADLFLGKAEFGERLPGVLLELRRCREPRLAPDIL